MPPPLTKTAAVRRLGTEGGIINSLDQIMIMTERVLVGNHQRTVLLAAAA